MKVILLVASIAIIAIANNINTQEGHQTWFSKPAQAQTIEVSNEPLKPLNRTGTSYDCRGYENELKIRPHYVPNDSFVAAQCASKIFDIPIQYIIGIQQLECNFGQSNAQDVRNRNKTCRDQGTKNGCSAAGPGQFIPQTWDKRNTNGKCNYRAGEIREGNFGSLKEPAREAGVPGYGMDCDGDGIANPWSVLDAACATANYIKQINLAVKGDWNKTFRWYNGGPKGDSRRTGPYAHGVEQRANHFLSQVG